METVFYLVLLLLGAGLIAWLAPLIHRGHGDARTDTSDRREQEDDFEPPELVRLPIDGALDLHTFAPKEVGRLVPEWLNVCRDQGLSEVRIIHGKGKGVLRRKVHAILDRHPAVEEYRLAGPDRGSWGATIVRLRPPR